VAPLPVGAPERLFRKGGIMVYVYSLFTIVISVVALFAIFVALRPANFSIQRSIIVAAPAEKSFDQVNDFHAWGAWSPWEKIDPQLKRTYEGPRSGAGAKYAWVGNNKVGEGKMTIEKSDRPSRIVIKLEFIKPFTTTNKTTFTFDSVPNGTNVTWTMEGRHNFMGKAFALLMNMDKMCGGDFERGLASIKSLAENAASKRAESAHAV
jgi:hypothetical protein